MNVKRCHSSNDYDISYGDVLCVKKVLDLDPQDSPENLGNEGDNSDRNLAHDKKTQAEGDEKAQVEGDGKSPGEHDGKSPVVGDEKSPEE